MKRVHCTGLQHCPNAKHCEHARLHKPILVTEPWQPKHCNTCNTYCAHGNQVVTCK
jgi:hypothetical protein